MRLGMPWRPLPQSDGAIDADDRLHLLGLYVGEAVTGEGSSDAKRGVRIGGFVRDPRFDKEDEEVLILIAASLWDQ